MNFGDIATWCETTSTTLGAIKFGVFLSLGGLIMLTAVCSAMLVYTLLVKRQNEVMHAKIDDILRVVDTEGKLRS